MPLKPLRILTLFLLIGLITSCSKRAGGESTNPPPGPPVVSRTIGPQKTVLDFSDASTTCEKFFSFLEIADKAYLINKSIDIPASLQKFTKEFVTNELQKNYEVETDGAENKPIKKNDCSVFFELAKKIKGNNKIMSVYNETEESFDPLNYIFDHVLYYFFDAFDLVSSYEGRYTREYQNASASLNSGLRLLVKADYYPNWARKMNGATVPPRKPKYLVVEYSPQYLQKMLPKKTRINKINNKPVHEIGYSDSLEELESLKIAELAVQFWNDEKKQYSDETNVAVEFQEVKDFESDSRQISFTHLTTNQNIAYIQIPTFNKEELDTEMLKSWVDYLETINGKSQGTIIDLRNNSGGSAYEAAKLLGMVLPENAVVSHYVQKNPETNNYQLKVNTVKKHFALNFGKIVVLINSRSASAAEVFAQTLKDYGAAVIVGEKSIGKGIGQHSLEVNENHLRGIASLTNFYVFSPKGESWYMKGVNPDIEVVEPTQTNYVWNFYDVKNILPPPYTNKPNISFDPNATEIRNKVSSEMIVQLRTFRSDANNEPVVCKKNDQ
jgi:C-terminal peptidase prc